MRRMLVLAFAASMVGAAIPELAGARARKVSSFPVTFSVQNVNRSLVACGTDGARYEIKGHVTGPRSALTGSAGRKRAVTLYLHGLGLGEWFWNLEDFLQPGGLPGPRPATRIRSYDYARAQAGRGHLSVTIDRLGYGASGHPEGNRTCLGGQADIAHQVVQALRSGGYSLDGRRAIRFKKVALGGHSIGAEIAMIEVYSFKDVDALIDMSFSFQNLPRAQLALGPTRDACLAGGEPVVPGGPSGYAYFGKPATADFEAIMFRSATQIVKSAAATLRNRDPCGDIASIIPALLQQQANVSKVRVPLLVICGSVDVLYAPLGCRMQADRFRRARSRTVEVVRNSAHAIALERAAPSFRRKVSRWLDRRGF
jgi:pimeloyl-ACP methyl ester carboxylesterase